MLRSFNHTHIYLIPKVNDAKDMSQVRPISLCSVFYKIISKILVHRLQKHMNKIISPNQSAFINGRLISDNILVAHECMHHLKNKRMGGEFEMALKLDMSKAYDRVEWSFLWFIMEKLGFDNRWINWVKECVSTVSYSVIWMVNLMAISSQIEGSVKEILYLHTFSCFARKDYPSCSIKQNKIVRSKA